MKRDGSQSRLPDLSWRQWGLVGFVAFCVVAILVQIAFPDERANINSEQVVKTEQSEIPTNPALSEAVEDVQKSKWFTYENLDELRGTKNKFANILSLNGVRFDPPYCCDSKLTISIRKTSQYGEDVIFQISDGQFQCGLYECSGMISFDGKPEKLTLSSPESGDPKVLFAKYPKPIIRKLNSAESTIIELPFFQEGRRQFKFETYGLEWE